MVKTIPYTIIGGYLGAGKTTLLNELLRNNRGLRLAVLVNDFGDINIDADLVVNNDGETINLASGCICCSLADGFMQALSRLRDKADDIDHIIVEASGVSNPVKIGQYGAILRYGLAGIIVLADAEQIQDKAANKYVGDTVIRQLRGADLLVLNKVDLVSPEQLAEVRAWLAEVAPGIRIVEATYGKVPLSILLGNSRRTDDLEDENHSTNHDQEYDTWSFKSDIPLNGNCFKSLVTSLPHGVLRAKGVLYLQEDPELQYVFQLVGKRWRIEPIGALQEKAPSSNLVMIGTPNSINDEWLYQKMQEAELLNG
jgi:G3E family GTPase